MPLDAITIRCLAEELDRELAGSRIDRIRQPEKDVVVLSLHSSGQNCRLLLCFGSGSARVCLTETEFENPPQPPMFCMLLRKHLTGARIVHVSQPDRERMLLFELTTYDELGAQSTKTLAAELMGRNANLVLIDAEGRILDAARRIDPETSPQRPLMPGLVYHMPPRPDPARFSGLSPLIQRELEFRGLPTDWETALSLTPEPTILMENGSLRDFSFIPILQYGPSVESISCESWSAMLDRFYAERDRQEHLRSRARSLTKLVKNARSRTERKLSARLSELRASEDRELDRRRGDLITANIWRMRPGQTEVTVEDFYEEGAPEVTIPLDPRKSPQQNAAAFYRQYTKKKAAHEHLQLLIEENRAELAYLGSVADELERAAARQDLDDIRAELEQSGYLRKGKPGKQKKPKPAQPLRFTAPSGLEILVGRNNIQNDELTFRTARRTDLWLHAQKLHGAHVILCCGGVTPDEADVYAAACLAAYHSEGRQAGRVAVDAAMVRNVKKQHGGRPGQVIYTGQKTIMAEPKEPG